MTKNEIKNLKSALIPLESAILLNATFSYLAWSKPFDNDTIPKTVKEAYALVSKLTVDLSEQALRKVWSQEEQKT